ncbi:hypothetical protein VZT92_002166 [Zoarces viviparus]|uniref:Uncharacterized protein n=1 Tax=Zoarces viviparus TaxID=48416 RepID=A0AAW1G0V4_ZOAVI
MRSYGTVLQRCGGREGAVAVEQASRSYQAKGTPGGIRIRGGKRKVSEGPLGLGCRPPEQGALAGVPHRSDGLVYTEKPDLMWSFHT